jgi:hypothetical protein
VSGQERFFAFFRDDQAKERAMRAAIIWIIVFICLSADVFASGQAPVVVDVEGFADIQGGRREQARENALHNAFRMAIEQVVGVMITSKTVVQDTQLLQDKIYSKSSGFIKTYTITRESFENNGCRLQVRATVSTAHLQQGLDEAKLLSIKMGKPRLAVIISERNITADPALSSADSPARSDIAESVIQDFLQKKEYNMVDRETLVALARQEGSLSAGDAAIPQEAAIQVASRGGAEIMVIGQAVAKAGATPLSWTTMRPSQAQVTAKVVDADTGQIIASHSTSAVSAHVNPAAAGAEAIRNASRELAEILDRQILAAWRQRVVGPRTARVVIRGVAFDDISRLRELMKQRLNSVEETLERGYRNGALTLDVEINGTPRELAEEMGRVDMKGFRSRVLSYTGNTLNLQLIKK